MRRYSTDVVTLSWQGSDGAGPFTVTETFVDSYELSTDNEAGTFTLDEAAAVTDALEDPLDPLDVVQDRVEVSKRPACVGCSGSLVVP